MDYFFLESQQDNTQKASLSSSASFFNTSQKTLDLTI